MLITCHVCCLQELVEGKSLGQMVEAGWQPEQHEVERIAKELLSTFSYLQDQKVKVQLSCVALVMGFMLLWVMDSVAC